MPTYSSSSEDRRPSLSSSFTSYSTSTSDSRSIPRLPFIRRMATCASTACSNGLSQRTRQCDHRQRSASDSTTSASANQTDVLSSSLQKKQFGALEILDIDRHALTRKLPRSAGLNGSDRRPSASSTDLPTRPKTAGLRPKPSFTSLFHAAHEQEVVSEADVQWYMTLPPKIQKQQFSRGEQLMFAERALKAAREAAQSRTLERPSFHSPSISRPSTSPGPAQPEVDLDKIDAFLTATATVTAVGTQPRQVGLKSGTIDAIIRRDSHSSSDDYFTKMSVHTNPPPPNPAPRMPVVKVRRDRLGTSKAVTLAPIKLPPPRLRPQQWQQQVRRVASTPRLRQNNHSYESNITAYSPSDEYDVNWPLRDSPVTPSAQFDHGLCFDFEPEVQRPLRSATLPFASPALLSYHSSEDSIDGDDISIEALDPITPNTVPEDTGRASPLPKTASPRSIGSDLARDERNSKPRPLPYRSPLDGAGYESTTVRLTLTRPALRTPSPGGLSSREYHASKLPCGVDVHEMDPLALPPLPIYDDNSGAQKAFSILGDDQRQTHRGIDLLPSKALRRVWRKNLKKT